MLDVLGLLAGGFATALQPINIAFLFVGVTLGLVIGVLPGLGGTSGVAILLPISVVIARGDIAGADTTTAVILLAGIYWGALFGGVITSILFNIPGEPWSVVLLFDGFPLAKRKGKPGLALTSSFLASFVGAFIATVLFTLFAIGEILASAEEQGIGYMEKISAKLGFKDLVEALGALRKRWFLVVSNSFIGFLFGVLPGHGATAASFLGYGLARQYAKNKEDFGKGEISGIMGPQATADAAGVASLVPMVTLGVPGSPTSAVIMAGLFVWGLQPGPLLFTEHSTFVWGLIASIYLGHFLTFILCLLAVPLLASIMRVPYAIITPFIVVISIIGSYSLNNSMLDVAFTVIFGLVGYWLRKMKYPLAPLVVALVLGDSTERELRKTLIAGAGNPAVFFSSPLSSVIMILAVVLLLYPLAKTIRGRLRPAPASAAERKHAA